MYYLQSRYYDPAIGRFINADTFATTDANGFLSCNMFAYCENNPVNRSDGTGEVWNLVAGAVIGAAVNLAVSITMNKLAGNTYSWKDALVDIGTGALSGALAASGLGLTGQTIGNALIAGGSSIAGQLVASGRVNGLQVLEETLVGGLLGRFSGKGLASSSKAARQIKIIDTNMTKLKYISARGNVRAAMKQLSGDIRTTFKKYVSSSVFGNSNSILSRSTV